MTKRRANIGIAHPRLGRGGSEAACLWAIEGLKKEYNVTLITTGAVNLTFLNQYYGTNIQPHEIQICIAPLTHLFPKGRKATAIWMSLHQRYCRKIAPEFDVLLSAYNPLDFGRPAIHRIADFGWDSEIQSKYEGKDNYPTTFTTTLAQKLSRFIGKLLRKPSGRDIFGGEDILVANSRWTANVLTQKYKNATLTHIYPPVPGDFELRDWDKRESGFVCLGRIGPLKRTAQIIAILKRVRLLGHNIHLHIIGNPDTSSDYGDMIKTLCNQNADWVHSEGWKWGKEKKDLLSSHRYAIHGRLAEPFGIAVAEMVKAGCITFVPNGGAPPEIVGNSILCYLNEDDAVEKIDALLHTSEEEQRELHTQMLNQGQYFTVESYQRGIQKLIGEVLGNG